MHLWSVALVVAQVAGGLGIAAAVYANANHAEHELLRYARDPSQIVHIPPMITASLSVVTRTRRDLALPRFFSGRNKTAVIWANRPERRPSILPVPEGEEPGPSQMQGEICSLWTGDLPEGSGLRHPRLLRFSVHPSTRW